MVFAPGIDDRGRPVRLLLSDPRDVPSSSPLDGVNAEALVLFRIGVDAIRSRAGWYIATMLILLAFDCLALWAAGPLAMFLVLSSPIASIVLVLVVNAAVGVGRVLDDRKRNAKELWLAAGRCPCCGYSLSPNAPPGDRTLLSCSECGAAWRPLELCEERIVVSRIRASDSGQVLA